VSALYGLVGRLYVTYLWRRYGKQLRIAAGAGVAALAIGAYLVATREPPEG
jgi:hypothetical protein